MSAIRIVDDGEHFIWFTAAFDRKKISEDPRLLGEELEELAGQVLEKIGRTDVRIYFSGYHTEVGQRLFPGPVPGG